MKSFIAPALIFSSLFLAIVGTGLYANKPNRAVPSSIQNPPILPTITSAYWVTVTPTPIQTYQPPANTIDCIGPDGKHLQVTQTQCDDFNKAWKNYYPFPTSTQNTFSNNQETTNSPANQYIEYMNKCNKDQENDPATKKADADRAIMINPQATTEEKNSALADLSTQNYILSMKYNCFQISSNPQPIVMPAPSPVYSQPIQPEPIQQPQLPTTTNCILVDGVMNCSSY